MKGHRRDLPVAGEAVVELKTVDVLLPIHDAQVLSYLKLTGLKLALLINCKTALLEDGIKRFSLRISRCPLCLCDSKLT